MSRLVAYTLMGLLALLILVVCVSVLFEAPREGAMGPLLDSPHENGGLGLGPPMGPTRSAS